MAESIPSNLTVKELEESGAPGMSAVQRWYNSAKGASSAMTRAKVHAAAAGNSLRSGGEAAIVGGLLGIASAQLPTGLDVKKVPIDAVIAGLGLIGGAVAATEEFGVDLRNAGTTAMGVFTYRKAQAFWAAKMQAAGKTPGFANAATTAHGDFGAEDPVVAAARFL